MARTAALFDTAKERAHVNAGTVHERSSRETSARIRKLREVILSLRGSGAAKKPGGLAGLFSEMLSQAQKSLGLKGEGDAAIPAKIPRP